MPAKCFCGERLKDNKCGNKKCAAYGIDHDKVGKGLDKLAKELRKGK